MTKKKRLHRLLALIIPLLLLGVGLVSLYLSEPPKRVWVIHSHDAMYEQYKEYNQLLAKELRSHGVRAELSFNYLDCNRYIEIHEDSIMNHWIDSVSQRGSWPDLIITTEDQSTYALLMSLAAVVMLCMLPFRLAKAFGKSVFFGIGLLLLSPVFLLILGFDGSAYCLAASGSGRRLGK